MPHVPRPLDRSTRLAQSPRSGVVVETAADLHRMNRLVEFGAWLMLTSPSEGQTRTEWYQAGAGWLRPGDQWSAVVVPALLVHAAVGRPGPQESAPLLATLDGPVFYRPGVCGRDAAYTALLDVKDGREWDVPGTRVNSSNAMVLVPAPGAVRAPGGGRPWWVVPGYGSWWCEAGRLAALVESGRAAGGARRG